MTFKNIKWIFFDVGSTLIDEHIAYEHRFKDIASMANCEYQYVYKQAINLYKQNRKGDLEIAKQLGVQLPKWHSEDEILYSDTAKCIEELSLKYKIGIIANQSLGTKERLKNHKILKYIDLVIASAEEGVAKPDRRIFEIALERSQCKPSDAVMVGDRIDNDIIPAKLIGMNTIWVKQGFGKYWSLKSREENPDCIINSIGEICDCL